MTRRTEEECRHAIRGEECWLMLETTMTCMSVAPFRMRLNMRKLTQEECCSLLQTVEEAWKSHA